MDNELFKNNVSRWAEICPKAANTLLQLKNSGALSLWHDEKGLWNIQLNEASELSFYHAPENPLQEAKDWFSSLNLYGVKSLFVYGVGVGYYFLAAKEWLKEDPSRSLIFIEDDLKVIFLLFHTEIGKELNFHSQVRLHYFQKSLEEKEEEENLFSIPLIYFMTDIAFSALKFYAEKFPDELPILNNRLEYIKNCRGFQFLEYITYGETFFQNFFRNMFALPSAYLAEKMFGKFKGMPAIICGAGPSLEKDLADLETLTDRALIFAGGSSINTISLNGLLPHFCVSIDPNWNQYARLFMNQAFQVPFFYRNRIFPQALSLIQGDRLYVPGSGGHEIAKYFEKKLGIEASEEIPEGNNVVNFSLSIATALGCNPIILLGVDLAYTEDKSYAPGILKHPIFDADKEISTRSLQEDLITKTDVHGKTVNTLWKWVAESLWITQFAVTHPEIEIINATDGGIGFEGVKNIPLKDLLDKVFSRTFDMKTLVHKEIQDAKMPAGINKNEIINIMKELIVSLNRCKDLCGGLRAEFHKTLKEMNSSQKVPENLLTANAMAALKALHEEAAYESVLDNFNKSFIGFLGKQENELEMNGKDSLNISILRALMNKRRYEFLGTVCTSCLKYIDEALNTEHLKELIFEAFGKKSEAPINLLSDRSEDFNLYYSNGAKYGVQRFNEGKWDGLQEFYYPEGQIKSQLEYRLGKLHGRVTLYYPDGFKMRELTFQEGKRHGPEILWNIGGIKEFEGSYNENKPVGVFRTWYATGSLSREFTYDDEGILIDAKGWKVDGSPLSKSDLIKKDYFGKISEQTNALTNSLENVFNEVETMTTLIEQNPALKAAFNKIPDLSEDLNELKEELKNLRSMNVEMEEGENLVSKEATETIWKTPAMRKIIGQEIQKATNHMSEDIKELEEVMKIILKSLNNKCL